MGSERSRSDRLPDLPDEMVEKIISMMPFPSIFKARTLSKAWLARFSPIKPLDDEKEEKHGATRWATRFQARKSAVTALHKQVPAFQKQVLERSANWPIFFPAKLDRWDSSAYELASHTWRRVPSLSSFLPKDRMRYYEQITTAGALLLLCKASSIPLSSRGKKLCIANIFTRSSKILPPAPEFGSHTYICHAHIVTNQSMQTYKVIVLFYEFTGLIQTSSELCLQTYDSKSNAWSSNKLGSTPYWNGQKVVHLNGVLYWAKGRRKLIALDCEEGTLTELPLFGLLDGGISTRQQLVVCGSSLVMDLTAAIDSEKTHKLMKIDLGSGRLSEIAIGGLALDWSHWNRNPNFQQYIMDKIDPSGALGFRTPVGHGDCIYFGLVPSSGRTLAYNLAKDEWSCWDVSPMSCIDNFYWEYVWRPCVFQPGLNVFMPV